MACCSLSLCFFLFSLAAARHLSNHSKELNHPGRLFEQEGRLALGFIFRFAGVQTRWPGLQLFFSRILARDPIISFAPWPSLMLKFSCSIVQLPPGPWRTIVAPPRRHSVKGIDLQKREREKVLPSRGVRCHASMPAELDSLFKGLGKDFQVPERWTVRLAREHVRTPVQTGAKLPTFRSFDEKPLLSLLGRRLHATPKLAQLPP